jgi:hypothetical protein
LQVHAQAWFVVSDTFQIAVRAAKWSCRPG